MLSEQKLQKLIQCGALGYPLKKILNVLEIEDVEEFKKNLFEEGTQEYEAHQKGKDIGEFAIDSALFNKAKDGNAAALRQIQKRRKTLLAEKKRDKEK